MINLDSVGSGTSLPGQGHRWLTQACIRLLTAVPAAAVWRGSPKCGCWLVYTWVSRAGSAKLVPKERNLNVEAEWMSRVETQVEDLKEETNKLQEVQLDLVKETSVLRGAYDRLATKEDVARSTLTQIKWLIGVRAIANFVIVADCPPLPGGNEH